MSDVKFAEHLRAIAEASQRANWISTIAGKFPSMEAEAEKGKFDFLHKHFAGEGISRKR